MIPEAMRVEPGTYAVIRANGECATIPQKPTIGGIQREIGAQALDTVNLGDDHVMAVDDTGMLDKKPVNPIATTLYRAICRPGTPYRIHGDVVICRDSDFA